MNKLWGVKELGQYLDIPVQTLYRWRTRGYGPPGRRVGKYVRYRPVDVEAWLDSQPQAVS
jgi:predicted DNA-binding transcriptional regulator AlpA